MPYEYDETDQAIVAERLDEWNARTGPRVGDFVILTDGTIRRFTHDWGDDIQTTTHPNGDSGSFYFYGTSMDFSGSLAPGLDKSTLHDTSETADGRAWIFHHGQTGAHRGVYFTVPCRVFCQAPATEASIAA